MIHVGVSCILTRSYWPSGPRSGKTAAMPARGRDIFGLAERKPDVAWFVAPLDGLVGGDVTQGDQHDVAGEHTAVDVAELIGDGLGELTLAH